VLCVYGKLVVLLFVSTVNTLYLPSFLLSWPLDFSYYFITPDVALLLYKTARLCGYVTKYCCVGRSVFICAGDWNHTGRSGRFCCRRCFCFDYSQFDTTFQWFGKNISRTSYDSSRREIWRHSVFDIHHHARAAVTKEQLKHSSAKTRHGFRTRQNAGEERRQARTLRIHGQRQILAKKSRMRSINSRSNTVQASLFTTNYSWKVRTKYQCFSHATERSEVFHHGLLLCWWQNKTSWCVHSENVGLPGLALAPGTTEHLKKPEEIISPILTNPNFGNPDFQEKNVVKNEPAFFASQLESLCQYLYCEMWRMSDMWQQSRREWTLPSRWLCPEWFRTFCCNDRFVLILLPLNSNRLYSFLNYVIECQVLRSTVVIRLQVVKTKFSKILTSRQNLTKVKRRIRDQSRSRVKSSSAWVMCYMIPASLKPLQILSQWASFVMKAEKAAQTIRSPNFSIFWIQVYCIYNSFAKRPQSTQASYLFFK